MEPYFLIKAAHIISSSILFGTGIGIAFFMVRTHFTQNLQEKYYAARNTVLADGLFTFPAVIVQPVTGIALIKMGGFAPNDFWLVATYIIYAIAGICWLPVVWIQIKLRNILRDCLASGENILPKRYYQLFKIWFLLGWPAFGGLLYVYYLMVAKPQ